jgi:peptidoglycan/xylan/chitin deacetylase (PgdA/CDA1 family)
MCAQTIAAILFGGLGLSVASDGAFQAATSQSLHGPAHSQQVALVFEISQGTKGVAPVLEVLRRLGVPATFFFTGRWADENPELAQAIAEDGHAIGNGAWSRKDLNKLAGWEIKREALQADDHFVSRFARNYVPLFRPPCGRANPQARAIIHHLGFTLVHCTFDSTGPTAAPADASMIERHILQRTDEELDGASILLHASTPQTAEALATVVRSLWRRGFEFVSLTTWIGIDPSLATSERSVLNKAMGWLE